MTDPVTLVAKDFCTFEMEFSDYRSMPEDMRAKFIFSTISNSQENLNRVRCEFNEQVGVVLDKQNDFMKQMRDAQEKMFARIEEERNEFIKTVDERVKETLGRKAYWGGFTSMLPISIPMTIAFVLFIWGKIF
jgi:hypothetical protein